MLSMSYVLVSLCMMVQWLTLGMHRLNVSCLLLTNYTSVHYTQHNVTLNYLALPPHAIAQSHHLSTSAENTSVSAELPSTELTDFTVVL